MLKRNLESHLIIVTPSCLRKCITTINFYNSKINIITLKADSCIGTITIMYVFEMHNLIYVPRKCGVYVDSRYFGVTPTVPLNSRPICLEPKYWTLQVHMNCTYLTWKGKGRCIWCWFVDQRSWSFGYIDLEHMIFYEHIFKVPTYINSHSYFRSQQLWLKITWYYNIIAL